MPTETKLRNCPFCGKDDLTISVMKRWITCGDCLAMGPSALTESEAIAAWNARVDPVKAQLAEALRDADATLCACRYGSQRLGTDEQCNCDIHAAHRILRAALAAYDSEAGEKAKETR